MKVLVFGGTEEGRILPLKLAALGVETTVCVATPLGAEELGKAEHIRVLVGRLDEDEMAALMQGFDLCVDATHPYSTIVSANIAAACKRAGLPRRRLLREESTPEGCIFVKDVAEAVEYLKGTEGNILLTTGSKTIAEFAALDIARIFVRVLPTHESLTLCEEAGIPHKQILALQGPFTQRMNEATMEQYNIRYLVTRDGGKAGGFEEKRAATLAVGAECVLIGRPGDKGESLEEIIEFVKNSL